MSNISRLYNPKLVFFFFWLTYCLVFFPLSFFYYLIIIIIKNTDTYTFIKFYTTLQCCNGLIRLGQSIYSFENDFDKFDTGHSKSTTATTGHTEGRILTQVHFQFFFFFLMSFQALSYILNLITICKNTRKINTLNTYYYTFNNVIGIVFSIIYFSHYTSSKL